MKYNKRHETIAAVQECINKGNNNIYTIAKALGRSPSYIFELNKEMNFGLEGKRAWILARLEQAVQEGVDSMNELSKILSRKPSTIMQLSKDYGIPLPENLKPCKSNPKIDKVLSRKSVLTYQQAADELGITKQAVWEYAKNTYQTNLINNPEKEKRRKEIEKKKREKEEQEKEEQKRKSKRKNLLKKLGLEEEIKDKASRKAFNYLLTLKRPEQSIGFEKIKALCREHQRLMNNDEKYNVREISKKVEINYLTARNLLLNLFGWFPSQHKE